jgi:NAD(P)H-hydrate epimerase
VRVFHLSDPAQVKGAAQQALLDYSSGPDRSEPWRGTLPENSDLLVDAMLGTGLDRKVEGVYLQAIEAMNHHRAPALAVDIPSGLQADSGRVLGCAVQAQRTVTFIGRKRGLYTGEAVSYAGRVDFDDLGVAAGVLDRRTVDTCLIVRPPLGPLASPRWSNVHKGSFGHVLVVGGDLGMSGAIRLAGEAAARCGAGLVSLATRVQHAAMLNAGRPELMVHGVSGRADLGVLLARATVVVVGPGLGRCDWSRELLETVLESRLPLVVDADALNLLATEPLSRGNWILTPHPGEAGRLLGISSGAVQRDRFAAVHRLTERFGGVAVLKGSGSLVSAEGAPTAVCNLGNPGMASGGMGDVLSGVLAALLAQGLSLVDAAAAGVWLHARAADMAAGRGGQRGLLASDLMPILRELVNG